MPTEMERKVLLVQEDRRVIALLPCRGGLLNRGVGALHIGCVVLVVVQLVDLTRDVRFQRTVVVGQFGQGVLSHEIPFWSSVAFSGINPAPLPRTPQQCLRRREGTSIRTQISRPE